MAPLTLTVHGIYQLKTQIGEGSFAQVWTGYNLSTGENIAAKIELPPEYEPITPVPMLPYEAQVYRMIHGHTGFPSVRWSGADCEAHVLILDKLGATIEQFRCICRGRLSRKTVLMVAIQALDRIEFAHSRGVIIRDIFTHVVYLIDLGLAKLYQDAYTGKHMSFREGRGFVGPRRFASYNMHFGSEQSRRDDLEMLGNVLLYLFHGRLPWQRIYAPDYDAKLIRIGEMKVGKTFQELLERSPAEFRKYFDHCRRLSFEEKPDYAFLNTIFHEACQGGG
ncbi:casein kinase I isoform delta-like protein [Artomyces pyxidatus]|uniref:Casein kinase I isoform delta-like protein n=1 Tax=Artomyces pyxidatus TaxID=48021 RepID=A0ACB8T0V9_9AGAM|nr:casein kinase I isoform delta-like protein [Artomyces pyxidatus]